MQLPPFLATPRLRWRAVLVAALMGLVLWVLISGWTALLPFFIGLAAAYLLLPLVHLVERLLSKVIRRKPVARTLSVLVVFVLTAAMLVLILFNFVPIIWSQFRALLRMLPLIYNRVVILLQSDWPDFVSRLPLELQDAFNNNLNKALNSLLETAQRGALRTVTYLTQTLSFALGLLVVPFWLFVVMRDEHKVWRGFYSLMPGSWREDVRNMVTLVDHVLHSYIRSQVVGMLLVGVITGVTFLVMGIDLAILWGTLAGVTEVIPIIGPYLGVIPPVIWAIAYRPDMILWVILAYVIVQNVVGSLIMPHISGNATRLHPAVAIVLVLVGAQVAGFWGVLLGVPFAAMVRDVFRYLYLRTTEYGTTAQEAMETFQRHSGANPRAARNIKFIKA